MLKTEKRMVAAGVGAAVAAAALGTYFLYGERGAKNRKAVAGWVLKMKGEVLEKVEEARNLTEEEYHRIVDEVSARYAKLGKGGTQELADTTTELKGAWQQMNGGGE